MENSPLVGVVHGPGEFCDQPRGLPWRKRGSALREPSSRLGPSSRPRQCSRRGRSRQSPAAVPDWDGPAARPPGPHGGTGAGLAVRENFEPRHFQSHEAVQDGSSARNTTPKPPRPSSRTIRTGPEPRALVRADRFTTGPNLLQNPQAGTQVAGGRGGRSAARRSHRPSRYESPSVDVFPGGASGWRRDSGPGPSEVSMARIYSLLNAFNARPTAFGSFGRDAQTLSDFFEWQPITMVPDDHVAVALGQRSRADPTAASIRAAARFALGVASVRRPVEVGRTEIDTSRSSLRLAIA